ncbi:TonB-dependent hemoglobin/transferrin/lactoferrin family receptor [Wielerella bovis]|uniref:TonB-dependent hemoglobin/transferrin/lactoferrin family receptor n=1 Tax=Wielerella bovis TaxID=2917790 RepID=UPI0020188B52|nr:TonB-dependent hemoglobin/transferrin/lactoferrin family receptor [Wielerella bovis]ULJ64981.1 TonB-dependent hemoglobin/transferrin/lactoferrin family receptor [Wielerella bovis]ULJ67254.1 TonB-dependent hemoglobin/transferrin/lactoferrin family receptor [Wielerella bovis]
MKKLSLLLLMVFSVNQSIADSVIHTQELENIHVIGKRQRGSVISETKNRATITREMIRDNRDLVRYSADVGVAENGRHQKGFAMRGVDDNRVGIAIDGITLPDSEENSLYKRYGNFNHSRLRIDPELVRNIEVIKGSDSLNFGSGSLGGNVNYRTLSVGDIVRDDRHFGGMLRSGYSTKNREWVNTMGLGFRNDAFDAVILYTHRHGHETQNHDNTAEPRVGESDEVRAKFARHGINQINPDPSQHNNNGWLAKLGWQVSPSQRIALTYNGQRNSNFVNEFSYEHPTWLTGRGWRDIDDRQRISNAALTYELTPEASPISVFKVELDHARTHNGINIAKGQYNYISFNNYGYDKQHTEEYFQRYNKTKLNRLSLFTETNPFQFLGQHTLSFKILGGLREFENINNDQFFKADGTLEDRGYINWTTGEKMPNPDIYTIQHPVKTTFYGIAVQDKIKWNQTFSSQIGIRYDQEKYGPQHSSIACGNATRMGRLCGAAKDKTFRNWSGLVGLNAQLNDNWHLGYQISSGFRNPTASEMYFTFESFAGNWFANPTLKAEKSINHNITLSGSGHYGKLNLGAYHSRYRDFLYEREGWVNIENPYCNSSWCDRYVSTPYQQFFNADKAKISGIELKGSLNLNAIGFLPQGWQMSGALGWSKGQMYSEGRKVNLLAIQPLKAIIGLDYEHPSEKWGIFSRLTYNKGKNPKNAQYLQGERRCIREEFDYWYGSSICRAYDTAQPSVQQFPWWNQSAWIWDIYGYYRPMKNFTMRAGIYNVTNRKYHSWDTLRGLNLTGTSDRVARANDRGNHNQGLERFTAPGRNYAVSLEYKF